MSVALPEPFTPQEWHDISLCVGWIIALNDGDKESRLREVAAMRAMDAMRRVIGREDYHTAIREANGMAPAK